MADELTAGEFSVFEFVGDVTDLEGAIFTFVGCDDELSAVAGGAEIVEFSVDFANFTEDA